jgi:hypothetical protein
MNATMLNDIAIDDVPIANAINLKYERTSEIRDEMP